MHRFIGVVLLAVWLGKALAFETEDFITANVVESEPSAELSRVVQRAFESARVIRVSYIPRDKLGVGPIEKEKLVKGWVYQFSFRCPSTCAISANHVQSYFASGMRQDVGCPDPYYAVVELYDGNRIVFSSYVHSSGSCFYLDGNSFHTFKNFDEFVSPETLYPAFVLP